MKKTLLLLLQTALLLTLQAQDGTLDPTFGNGGFIQVGQSFTDTDFTPDGKLVGVKMIARGFELYSYNSNGMLDASFGNGGLESLTFPEITMEQGVLLAVQENGKIVVQLQGFTADPNKDILVLARFLPDGSFDQSFGTAGISKVEITVIRTMELSRRSLQIALMDVQNDGKIVTVFHVSRYRHTEFFINRYNNDGTPDVLFNQKQLEFLPNFRILQNPLLALEEDGKIIFAYSDPGNCGPCAHFNVVRLNNDGTIAGGFSFGGGLPPQHTSATALAVQPDGKVLVVSQGSLLRFTGGLLDNTFGSGGSVSPPLAIKKILVQENGQLIVGGNVNTDVALANYNTNGTLNPNFGTGGVTISDFGGTESITDMIVTGNRLYTYGNGILAAYRINNGSTPCTAPTFRNDQTIVLDASCSGSDGNISIIPQSGTAPYMYSLDGGATYVTGPNKGYTFQNLSAGTYRLRLKDANGCESAVVSRQVRNGYGTPAFRNDPTIVLDASCSGNDGNISIIPTCGFPPFQYSINGGTSYIQRADHGYTFQNLAPGTYQLRLKDVSGKESAVVTKQVRANAFGPCSTLSAVKAKLTTGLRIVGTALHAYPNPSKGRFTVQLDKFQKGSVQVQVLNVKGEVVQQQQVAAGKTNLLNLDLSGKTKGLYLIRVVSENGVQVSKLIIQ